MRLAVLFLLLATILSAANKILIVADEIPAMEILAAKLKATANIDSLIVKQPDMPTDISGFSSVVVYIHKTIAEPPEKAFIAYAEAGGNLVLLHHSISSGKRPNKFWFPFLHISLPEGPFDNGGYRWTEPAEFDIVNLAPNDYITTHNMSYPEKVDYTHDGKQETLPGVHLDETEVYLNHVYSGPRTPLLGIKYTDPKTSKTYMQDIAGWHMPAGKGRVVYLMPGHAKKDFENLTYGQIVVNAIAGPR